MGNSKLIFEKAPAFLALIGSVVNDFKWLYIPLINGVFRSVLNIVLHYVPLPVEIPIYNNYVLDVSPIYQTAMDSAYSTMYFRSEVYNKARNVRAEVPAPKDLKSVPIAKPNTIELIFNNHLLNTALNVMARCGELYAILTDRMVFSVTNFLHLRTSDFRYYIPGLMEFKNAGDVPMELNVTFDQSSKIVVEKANEMKFVGKAQVGFIIPGKGEAIRIEVAGEASFSAKIEQKMLYARVIGIYLSEVQVVESHIPKPEVDQMKKEFNTLFKFVTNAVNIYALEQPVKIPDSISVGGLTVEIHAVDLELNDGVFGAALTFDIE